MLSRNRRKLSYIICIFMLSVLPVIIFVGIDYVQSIRSARLSLNRAATAAADRANAMLQDAERLLSRLTLDSDLAPSADTIRMFSRAEYIDPRFREIGLLDRDGRLVATSLGRVDPPMKVPPGLRADPALSKLQVIGLHKTYVMGERSIILSLPTHGRGELNALVDPAVLLGFLGNPELDPEGFAAFVGRNGQVLAKVGQVPIHDEVFAPIEDAAWLRASRTTDAGDISVVLEATLDWALHGWWDRLAMVMPFAVLCNGLLAMLMLRRFRRVSLDHDLRGGLKRDEFTVHYQPIVDLRTGRCIGAESLLRWYHPRHDVLRPGVFIPVAENTGALPDLTDWLLRKVSVETRPLFERHPDFLLSVNVAPSQLQSGAAGPLIRSIVASALDPRRLIIEITESSLWEVPDDGLRSAMAALNAEGPSFALDDFGNGCFSFENVVEMNFRYLKIDKSIIHAVGRDRRRLFVLDGLIDLAHKLRLEVIAEGVEQEEQRQYLLARGVRWGQGWLFSPAVPIAELERRLIAGSIGGSAIAH